MTGWSELNVGTSDEFARIRDNENYKLADGAFDNFISDESVLSSDLEKALNTKFLRSFV